VGADWPLPETLRVVANNCLEGNAAIVTTFTARTRNREKVFTRPLRIRKVATNLP